jgi:hypothetical protein
MVADMRKIRTVRIKRILCVTYSDGNIEEIPEEVFSRTSLTDPQLLYALEFGEREEMISADHQRAGAKEE